MRNEEDLLRRITIVKEAYRLNDSQIARMCDLTPSAVSLHMRGERKINVSLVVGLLDKIEELSAEWLLRGVGSMKKDGGQGPMADVILNDDGSSKTLNRLKLMARGCVSNSDFELLVDELKNMI